MSQSESGPDLLNELAYEFAERFRRGERPSVNEYTGRHPELAAQIRDLFPALAVIEQFGSVAESATGQDARKATATADGAAPRQLGEYRILREVARGGMGIVYEAIQESLGRHVALKVLPFQSLVDANHLERFRREAQAAARLHHTNIVPVFGVGEHEGVHYFAMQFIQGQPLSRILHELNGRRQSEMRDAGKPVEAPSSVVPGARNLELTVTLADGLRTGRFPGKEKDHCDGLGSERSRGVDVGDRSSVRPVPSSAMVSGDNSDLSVQSDVRYFRSVARLGFQIAEALEYANQQGIVHRDIKPSNLLLDTQGTVWITDFGLAKAEGTDELTGPGDLLGTLRYMAPERFQGQADPRSDIFSLGLTLYEMATLRPAFAADERGQLIERMLHAEPPRPRQLDGRIPRDLETIILKAIAREPDRRYQAAELATDLQRFLADRPILARRSTAAERFGRWCRRNPGLAGANIAAAVLTSILAIGSTVAAWTYRDQRDQIGRQFGHIQEAETRGRVRLFESLTAQASARRHSRQIGQRFDSLDALARAVAIAGELKLPASRLDPLRDEAIACLALPDMRPTGRVIHRPPGAMVAAFDSTMTRYAWRFRDGTIRVRRVADDEEVARFSARGDRDNQVFGFSPDGRYLATTDLPGHALSVWDIERHTACLSDPGHVTSSSAKFSPDSRRIALTHVDGELLVYDLATRHPSRLRRGPGPAQDLAYRPDGVQIAVIYNEKKPSCQIVEARSGKLVRSIPLPIWTEGVTWSADGATLATPCSDRNIYLWDAATGARRTTLEGSNTLGMRAAFHPAGTLLASSGWDGRLRLWDSALGRPVLSLSGGYSCSWPEFSQDGRTAAGLEDTLTSYQVEPALEHRTLSHACTTSISYADAAIRHDGRVLAVGTSRGVALWDLAHGAELAFLPVGVSWHLVFEPSGDLITSGSIGVRRWPIQLDLDRGEFRIGPPRHLALPAGDCGIAEDRLGRIVARPDHDFAFVATPGGTIHLGPLDDCRYVAVSPDGAWLATGSHIATKGAQVWRIRDATKVTGLPVDYGTGVVFSPDGKWLMTQASPCRLWTADTWREARQIGGAGLCFSPDGTLVGVKDATRAIRLVEIDTGRILARLESPDLCEAHGASFSPDGSRLVVTTNDGPAVHVWDLRAIRRHLAQMGLDWNAPAYPDNDPAGPSARSLPPLQVDLGPLPLTASSQPGLYEPVIGELEAALAHRPDQPDIRGGLAQRCNNYAWILANATGSSRNPERALALARRSVELAPTQAMYINTLGVAQYRAGRYAEAIATLDRSLATGYGASDGHDLFFQAMAHWHLDHKPQALTCFHKAVEWIEAHRPADDELVRFRAEAAALLGVNEKKK
jgi:serine/threonine protein kinase/WD40 repeat protein